ncbi:MAG: hypothetical protein LIO37_02865 [Clostridiales bacterium]|nr:hypothetical protein [Clostridiales bacterium]
MEIYVLVERRRSLAYQFLGALVLALAILSFIASLFVYLMIIPTVALGCVWFFCFFHHSKEFEYSYFDGEIKFARVMNKSRRKNLYRFSMDDVLQIAPGGDRSVYKYENDNKILRKDMTSGVKGAPYYVFVVRDEKKGLMMIKFEPDERMLNAIEMRHGQKVVRRAEDTENKQIEEA